MSNNQEPYIGIEVTGHSNIIITNGTITNFELGISCIECEDVLLSDLKLINNGY